MAFFEKGHALVEDLLQVYLRQSSKIGVIFSADLVYWNQHDVAPRWCWLFYNKFRQNNGLYIDAPCIEIKKIHNGNGRCIYIYIYPPGRFKLFPATSGMTLFFTDWFLFQVWSNGNPPRFARWKCFPTINFGEKKHVPQPYVIAVPSANLGFDLLHVSMLFEVRGMWWDHVPTWLIASP